MQRLLISLLCAGLPLGSALAGEGTPLRYEDFVARAEALHPGQTRAEIIAALGMPAKEGETFMAYSLTGLKPMPPPPGTTVYYAAEITLKDGRMVGAVKWAWMDTTGTAPPTSH